MTSIGLRPALLFFSLTGVNTAASISARKLSNGTTRAIISSGSPFAVIAASRLSASKNPNCPIVPTVHSLRSLLADLATVTRNVMAMDGAPEASFVLYPQLTPVQDRAFQLLDLGVKV